MRRLNSVVAKNTLSSFVSMVWLNILSVLSITIYVKLLGAGSWGIVAACSSLQLLFNLIDLGFGQIVPRWIAREANDLELLRKYISVFHKIYAGLALSGFFALQAGAYALAYYWFNVPAEQSAQLELCIRLIAFQLLFQFANSLYVGIWQGLQLQVQANLRASLFGTLKHAAAMAALLWLAPSPVTYAAAFGIVALAELVTSAVATQRKGLMARSSGSAVAVRPFISEAAVLSIGIMVGLAVSQMDRIVLSRSVPVDSFGVYVVVANLALAFLSLQAPLTRAYFPVLVQDIKQNGHANPATIRRLILGSTVVCVLPALAMCIGADWVLRLWLQNEHFVQLGTAPLRLLLIAMCLNAIYSCLYQVILAQGFAHIIVKINLACLVIGIVTVAILHDITSLWVGGAIWVTTTFTQLVLGLSWYWMVTQGKSVKDRLLGTKNGKA
ncbi:oligosaccharide flippase family protein [Limnohabitans sp. Jir72]|uniref:oligosaccharide flippase family protein n=1 Tax=Limnohabitans sp. Jir72 TaxID=1977909 RepID=UPI001304BC94|nr:oligosaccharide flippase family protein [Limnohabitans sp. Jir72]